MQVRVYNDFKRRLLNGEVPVDFPCTAVLLNSAFDAMYDHAAYFRDITDFNSYSANSLLYSPTLYGNDYTGSLLATGNVLETTYYRDTNLNDEDSDLRDLMIVTSANASAYSAMYARGSRSQNARFADYIDKYGYFYLVARADDFHTLVSRTQSLNMERFVVVLADNIEHIDVTGSCFGCSREYPFRGIFDGNGYSLCLHSMQINSRSNGVFGYISDEAIVRNLIISADATELDDTDSEILVTNTEQISLNTLKAGLGDVKFGVLAGTNNGTVENVLIDAKLKYNSDFTPSFCFVQNKTDYPTELVGGGWKQLSATPMSAVTELSAFDNICYPTSLCLNSEANLIPYIGYFNEGSFNTQTVPYSATYGNPLYTNTRKYDSTNLSYLADIYDLYKAKGNAYNSISNYLEVLGNASMGRTGYLENYSRALSYRLGPNNRQAYLIGGMFGLNNGDVDHCVCDVQMKFKDNFVALVGGLAGRGARGNIKDVAARAKFIGTSGVYTHDYQITNEKFKNAPASAQVYASAYARSEYSTAANTLVELSPTSLTKFDFNVDTKECRDVVPNFGTLTYAAVMFDSRKLDADLQGTLTLIGTGYQLTNTEAQQTDIDLSGKDVCFIYNYDVKSEDYAPSGLDQNAVFGTIHFSAVFPYETEPREESYRGYMLNPFDKVFRHSLSTTNLYAISSRLTNGIKLLTSDTTLLLASATQNSHCTINNNNKIVVPDLKLRAEFGNYNTWDISQYNSWAGAVSGIVTFNLSAANIKLEYNQTPENTRALTTMQEEDNINIRLAPVFNMGGMFGEYVYSNDQSVNSTLTCAEASGFKWHLSADNKTRGFSNFNNISHFASNIIIDSSNKSNSDMFTDSWAASANARVRNDLKFMVANIKAFSSDGYNTFMTDAVSAAVDSDDCTSGIHAFNTLNIYNHITPSVVTTNYTDHDDGDISDVTGTAPNLGITWLDQLFYSYGIHMGFNKLYGEADKDAKDYYELPYKQYNNPSACSGWYFNFPAQGSKFYGLYYNDGRSPVSANNDYTYGTYDTRLWRYTSAFTAAFDTHDGHIAFWYEDSDVYVTKQLTAYPNNYPLYRGRASIGDVWGSLTYNQSAYEKVRVGTTHFTAYSAIDEQKYNLLSASNALHGNKTTESYIYEYTQQLYSSGLLPQLNTHVYSVYGDYEVYNTDVKVDNAYVISSDSHENIYKMNGYANLSISAGTCSISIPMSGLPGRFAIEVDNASMTECVTGAAVHFDISKEYLSTDTPVLEVDNAKCYLASAISAGLYTNIGSLLPDAPASALATVYENTLYVTHPFTVPDYENIYLTVPLKLSYASNNTTKTAFTEAHIPIRHTDVDAYSHKLRIDEKRGNAVDNILTANTLCFGFVPAESDIIHILDRSVNSKAYAKTLSADDISYMLLLDDQQRPIVDMKFDATAATSAGFYIECKSLCQTHHVPLLTSGLLINITK